MDSIGDERLRPISGQGAGPHHRSPQEPHAEYAGNAGKKWTHSKTTGQRESYRLLSAEAKKQRAVRCGGEGSRRPIRVETSQTASQWAGAEADGVCAIADPGESGSTGQFRTRWLYTPYVTNGTTKSTQQAIAAAGERMTEEDGPQNGTPRRTARGTMDRLEAAAALSTDGHYVSISATIQSRSNGPTGPTCPASQRHTTYDVGCLTPSHAVVEWEFCRKPGTCMFWRSSRGSFQWSAEPPSWPVIASQAIAGMGAGPRTDLRHSSEAGNRKMRDEK
ncbi:hypothetical protein CMQ_3919 [Grosmannia clavigera kw1407]|uniref:Uncharacterized protein n=1 Tax=Grosmannia clavigera (strain kw1407 / UAMH 11150) TaxID=655863 RepID=F0XAK2_GROCL|nr:uncharacterized protein CMQ_3919 [Grosmannia clavigera kw1407]EFX05850.1 hypothetical protein CMQ_3919 [Grosmannia clavigera kw1407]